MIKNKKDQISMTRKNIVALVTVVILVFTCTCCAQPWYGEEKGLGDIGGRNSRFVFNGDRVKMRQEKGGMDGAQETGGCKNTDDQAMNPNMEAICADLERQLEASRVNPVLVGLFIFISRPLTMTRSLLEDVFAMI